VNTAGLKAKPELGIQFGSGGDSGEAELLGRIIDPAPLND
jgi:hypothetical protein